MTEQTHIAGQTPGEIPEVDYVALQPGQTIGRYEIVSVLGQGGFGITYRARDVQLGREVAIKEYLPSALAIRQGGATVLPRTTKMADDFGWGRDRFVTEGRTLASLHRATAIVHVFDYLEANGTAYIVMELLSGETLEDRINKNGKLSSEEVERILWPLLDGLEQVHSAGFLHRDIKPANILLDATGNPTLIDFGASRAAMAGRSTALTAIFTPGYAAAEQMTSAKQGPWTDIYGLSATLYHAIVGRTPPSAFDRMLSDTYEPLSQVKPAGFSPGVLAGIDAGLAVVASDRPQSIAGWRPILGMTEAPGSRRHGRHRQGAAAGIAARLDPAVARGAGRVQPDRPVACTGGPGARSPGRWRLLLRCPRSGSGDGKGAAGGRGGGGGASQGGRGGGQAAHRERAALEGGRDRRRPPAPGGCRSRRQEAVRGGDRRKVETEMAAQKKAEEEAKRKADDEAEARRKASRMPARPSSSWPAPSTISARL
jgi:serine/threonine protein kinase